MPIQPTEIDIHRRFLSVLKRLICLVMLPLLLTAGLTGASPAEETCRRSSQDYWIVSTYCLPQWKLPCLQDSCPTNIQFQVYHQPAGGMLYKTTMEAMQSQLDPVAPSCVQVHGSFVTIDSALHEARQTNRWIRQGGCDQPLNMIFFVWPSSDLHTILLPSKVVENGLKGAHNGIYLSHLIDKIPESSPVSLVGHSHGCRVIAAGLHYRAGGDIHGCNPCQIKRPCRPMRVVFAAAAINHMWLNPNNRYGLALTQVDRVLNIVNRLDLAITAYPLASPTYGRSIAKTGLTAFDRSQLGPYGCKVDDINLSAELGFEHFWENYYSRPELAKLIAPYIYYRVCGADQLVQTAGEPEEGFITKSPETEENWQPTRSVTVLLPPLPELENATSQFPLPEFPVPAAVADR